MFSQACVIHSVHREGVCVSQHALGQGVYPRMHLDVGCVGGQGGGHPPLLDTMGYGQHAGGMHLTGMLPCL